MGTDLYHTIPKYFEDRMLEHSMVEAIQRLDFPGEIIYEIRRHKYSDTIRLWLSDSYIFGEMDYFNRPTVLKAGDYILIAKPEGYGGVDNELIAGTKIGVGKLRDLMGALNLRKIWTYVPPSDEEREARKKKFAARGLGSRASR